MIRVKKSPGNGHSSLRFCLTNTEALENRIDQVPCTCLKLYDNASLDTKDILLHNNLL